MAVVGTKPWSEVVDEFDMDWWLLDADELDCLDNNGDEVDDDLGLFCPVVVVAFEG